MCACQNQWTFEYWYYSNVFGFCFRLDNCKINNIIGSIRLVLPGHLLCIIINAGSGCTRFCIDMHSLVILFIMFIYTTSIWCCYVYVKLLFVKSLYIHVVWECIILFIFIVVIILYTYRMDVFIQNKLSINQITRLLGFG